MLGVKSDKSDWLKVRNEFSAHAQESDSWCWQKGARPLRKRMTLGRKRRWGVRLLAVVDMNSNAMPWAMPQRKIPSKGCAAFLLVMLLDYCKTSEPLTVKQSIILRLSVYSGQNVCHCYLSSCISFPHCLVPVLLPTPLALTSNCYFTDGLVRSEKIVVHDPDRDRIFINGVAVYIKQETLIPDRIHPSSFLGLPSFQYCFICIQIHTDIKKYVAPSLWQLTEV